MGLLYRTWFGLTGWIVGVVLWLFILQGQVLWWQPAALWALFIVLWLITRQLGADSGALPFTAVLVFCGWVFLARLDPALAQGHFYGAMLGAVLYLFGLLVPAIRFPFTRLWAWAALGLLAVTAIWGESAGGARAWLSVGSLRFQPVELAKIFLMFYLGRQLS